MATAVPFFLRGDLASRAIWTIRENCGNALWEDYRSFYF